MFRGSRNRVSGGFRRIEAGQPFKKLLEIGNKKKKADAAEEPHGTQESNTSTMSSVGSRKAPWKP